jgi:carbon-monoxide dehydrogenase large subunit
MSAPTNMEPTPDFIDTRGFGPQIAVATQSTRCRHNPLGVKGCGEVGTIASPAAVMNAVIDALSPYGITHLDMPATSQRIWDAIQASRQPASS